MNFGRIITVSLVAAMAALLPQKAKAQKYDPVQWTLTADTSKAPPGATVPLKLTATIEPGWHLYSITTPRGGPNPTQAALAENPAVESAPLYQPKPERQRDPNFGIDTETFTGQEVLLIPARLKRDAPAGALELTGRVRYQACTNERCLAPKRKEASFTLTVDPSAPAPAPFAAPAGYTEVRSATPAAPAVSAAPSPETRSPAPPPPSSDGLGGFLLTAFGVGLLSTFTPCVFPMIPITVSFFLNQRGGIIQAVVFSLGIIVLFCALGLGVTAIVGPFGVGQLAASPWVNGFIALVFGAFSLSLLGAFEITLPSGLLTRLDQTSRRGGYLGTLLMGLTFSLTSFACVGPFVGPLLVSSVQAKGAQPVLGMMSFATGLASPFFLLAAFPSYLKKLPKSGGWLARVKVVMGFVLLALVFKYLSNIDQVLQSGILTRERFLAAWFVLFAMPGLYLLGLLRLEGIDAQAPLGIGRLLTALAFLIFAITLLPGMSGSPLGELDAYVPAPSAPAPGGGGSAQFRPPWMKNQYREALDLARQQNKLVLVNFTGYTCTNCHWMDANMFPRPEIREALQDFVLVELYTDGEDATAEPNQKLEEEKYGTNSEPFYVILSQDESAVATSGFTRSPQEFLDFLKRRPRV